MPRKFQLRIKKLQDTLDLELLADSRWCDYYKYNKII
jgi:hypothetical protein